MPTNKIRILAVDDKEENLVSLKSLLESPSCSVTTASSGRAALRILMTEEEFALILLDIQMPEMDGFEFASMIRESERNADIPIIFLTAYDKTGSQQFKGYSLGAVDYLLKPLNPDLLKARVEVFADLYHKNQIIKRHAKEVAGINLKLVETNRRLKAQTGELITAKEVAEKASLVKSEFLANMSHELRTPLTGILGMLEIAIGTELSRDQREYLSLAKTSSTTLLTLINDILDFAKIEAGSLDFDDQEFDLRATVEQSIRAMAIGAHQKGLEIVCDLHRDLPPTVIGDSKRLRQILDNLIGNAVKFTSTGEIVIRVWPEPVGKNVLAEKCRLLFSVQDTGIGISKNQVEKIFERFTQGDSSTSRNFGGTGLGLPIALQLVKRMEGEINLDSEVGKGSTFTFSVMLAVGKSNRSRSGESSLKGIRALIIEDNPISRYVLNEFLKGWEMRISLADSGKGGVLLLEEAVQESDPFQLLLLDCMMPEMDGFEVAERIRQNPALVGLTIMMVTSDDMIGSAARSRSLGVTSYLIKPVFQQKLLAAFKEALAIRDQDDASEAPDVVSNGNHLRQSTNAWRILLAEDSPISSKALVTILELKGWRVTAVANGREAVEAVKSAAFDLVLMDVQMPVMDGLAATRAIRSLPLPLGALPIIALTAHVYPKDLEKCLEAGMDSHAEKPVNFKALIARIETLLQERAIAAEPAGEAPDALASLLEAMEGNREIVTGLIGDFLAAYRDRLDEIAAAVAAGNAGELAKNAHLFKGSLGLFCHTEPLRLVQQLEEMGARNRLEEAPRTLELLKMEMEKLDADLLEFCIQQVDRAD